MEQAWPAVDDRTSAELRSLWWRSLTAAGAAGAAALRLIIAKLGLGLGLQLQKCPGLGGGDADQTTQKQAWSTDKITTMTRATPSLSLRPLPLSGKRGRPAQRPWINESENAAGMLDVGPGLWRDCQSAQRGQQTLVPLLGGDGANGLCGR